ncbi:MULTISPECIES: hypothetical protein [Cryobacterium]|uniref:hypothetical protein n=1 Tax=Cryobacterium TaxID=69578 RepID=UPI000CD489B2|nr:MULTISPECIES: hypothetical protein [Cryobacterium]POH63643.1 hypothetical protein C3B60_16140 [Cryobacterium zongtaii]TFC45568.1 hypothetical protein E3O57_07945 [Cryobacterium sp. TMN-39-2]
MSLSGQIDAGFARVAAEFKTVRTEIGDGGGGTGGGGVAFKGDWVAGAGYAAGDVVHALGGSWVARRAIPFFASIPPTSRGFTSGTSIDANGIPLAAPSGAVAGDLLVAVVNASELDASLDATVPGWATLYRQTGHKPNIGIYTRIHDGSTGTVFTSKSYYFHTAVLRAYAAGSTLGELLTGVGTGSGGTYTIPSSLEAVGSLVGVGVFGNGASGRTIEAPADLLDPFQDTNGSNQAFSSGYVEAVAGAVPGLSFIANSVDQTFSWMALPISQPSSSTFEAGDDWAPLGLLDAPAPPARATVTRTTPSLANSATDTGAITLAKSYRLLSISTDKPCRIRLYATVAQQAADAARAIGTDPTGNHGLMLEYVSTAGVLAATLSPAVDGTNLEATPSTAIPISIQNLSGGASTVTASFVFLGTE